MGGRLAVSLGFCILLNACGSADDSGDPTAQADCLGLQEFSVSANSIALPTAGVTLNSQFRFTPSVAYCEVVGEIFPVDPTAPSINFQVNLPSNWNAKGLQFAGTGAFGGELASGTGHAGSGIVNAQKPTPLAQRYATWGSDSGHQSSDGSFMLNDEALRNFGGEHLKKTHDVAIAIVNAFYGSAPQEVYIQGDEQGGRAALIAVQRWPADYNGAIAINPLTTIVGHHLAAINVEQSFAEAGARLSDTQSTALSNSVFGACDGLDGTSDGIIQNISACDLAFDIEDLACGPFTLNQDACLADTQIEALESMFADFATPLLIDGVREVSGWPVSSVADFSAWFNNNAPFFTPAASAEQLIRYGILRDGSATSDSFSVSGNEARISELSTIMDVSSDISEFVSGGGKLLVLHETSTVSSAHRNTLAWSERAAAGTGTLAADTYLDLKFVSKIDGDDLFGYVAALDRWSTTGVAPANLVSSDTLAVP